MNYNNKILDVKSRFELSGVPEGLDALSLAELAQAAPGWLLHIARDEGRMASLAEGVGFFAPGTHVLSLPAWETLPYDRVSPNAEIAATRMNTLARLVGQPPPKALFAEAADWARIVEGPVAPAYHGQCLPTAPAAAPLHFGRGLSGWSGRYGGGGGVVGISGPQWLQPQRHGDGAR